MFLNWHYLNELSQEIYLTYLEGLGLDWKRMNEEQ